MATLGIGGAFITADDPAAMASWYADAFGIAFEDFGDGTHGHVFGTDGPAGSQAILSFQKARSPVPRMPKEAPDDAPYGDQPFMVNIKTDDLDALLAHLKAMGTDARPGPEMDGIGRFAWVTDPEGNRVELWEPV